MARHAGLFLFIALWLSVARLFGLLLPHQNTAVVSGPAPLLSDWADRHPDKDEFGQFAQTVSRPGAQSSVVGVLQHTSRSRETQAGVGDPTSDASGFWNRGQIGSGSETARSRMPNFRKVLVAPQALVVVLSLDPTGAVHQFQYRAGPQRGGTSSPDNSVNVVSPAAGGAAFCDLADAPDTAILHEEPFQHRDRMQHPAKALFRESESHAGSRNNHVIRPVSIAGSFRKSAIQPAEKLLSCADSTRVNVLRGWSANEWRRSVRCFRMPRFSSGQSSDELREAEEFLRTDSVAVYLDSSLAKAKRDTGAIRNAGFQIAELCDGGLRRLVELQVGPIRDVDGDGRLSVVLTQLEPDQSSGSIPVRGCVRESDFLDASSGPPGDIIYLDISIPQASELTGLLAHEMTHAAMYSRLLDRREKGMPELNLPGWFHEAVAHRTEHQLAGQGNIFAERLRIYQANPAASPVCTNPLWLSYSSSRGGPRVAGARFLELMLRPDVSLAGIVPEGRTFDEILERCLGTSLNAALVSWGAHEAARLFREAPERIPRLKSGQAEMHRIYGTAFLVLQCGHQPLELEIGCEDTSDWNLTVIEP